MSEQNVILTKYDHACVSLRSGETVLLVDPGTFGQAPDLEGVNAVLFTHGHFDHFNPEVAKSATARGIPVYGPKDLASAFGADSQTFTPLNPGEQLEIGDFQIEVVGGQHAALHPVNPSPQNLAYLIDHRILVTGDQHPDITTPIDALLTPVNAPWLRFTDLIDYVGRTQPTTVVGIHDGLLNSTGLSVVDQGMRALALPGVETVVRPSVGESLAL